MDGERSTSGKWEARKHLGNEIYSNRYERTFLIISIRVLTKQKQINKLLKQQIGGQNSTQNSTLKVNLSKINAKFQTHNSKFKLSAKFVRKQNQNWRKIQPAKRTIRGDGTCAEARVRWNKTKSGRPANDPNRELWQRANRSGPKPNRTLPSFQQQGITLWNDLESINLLLSYRFQQVTAEHWKKTYCLD